MLLYNLPSRSCKRCGGLDGLAEVDPRLKTCAFNLREVVKQLILLEDHLAQPHKQCPDCIHKHMLAAEALAEEAVTLDGPMPCVRGLGARIRGLKDGADVRRLRKHLADILRSQGLGFWDEFSSAVDAVVSAGGLGVKIWANKSASDIQREALRLQRSGAKAELQIAMQELAMAKAAQEAAAARRMQESSTLGSVLKIGAAGALVLLGGALFYRRGRR